VANTVVVLMVVLHHRRGVRVPDASQTLAGMRNYAMIT